MWTPRLQERAILSMMSQASSLLDHPSGSRSNAIAFGLCETWHAIPITNEVGDCCHSCKYVAYDVQHAKVGYCFHALLNGPPIKWKALKIL